MDSVLYEAARILDERGWFQGGFEGPDGSVCMAGAIKLAVCGDANCYNHEHDYANILYYKKISEAARRSGIIKDSRVAVASINDDFAKTKEECVKILMEAAEIDLPEERPNMMEALKND